MAPPVLQFAAAYAASLWAGLQLVPPPLPTAVIAAATVLALARTGWRPVLVATAAVGVAAGAARGSSEASSCGSRWLAGPHAAIVRLHDAPGPRGLASATVLHAPEGCAGVVRLRLDAAAAGPAASGARVVVVGLARPNGVLRGHHLRRLGQDRRLRFRLRDVLVGRIRRLYGPRAPLVEAMVLGRRADLDPALRDGFAASGLAHLMAISGLHVGIVAGWVLMLARAAGARRAASLWSALAAWSYVALLGFPAPATRAAAFVAIYGIAAARERRPPAEAVLAVAVLVVLAIDPGAATRIGTWLSAAAVWGTTAANRLCARTLPAAGLLRLGAISAGATLATAPLTAFAFGQVAPVGVLTNLAAVPLAAVAVPGIFVSLIGGEIPAGGAGLALAGIELVSRMGAAIPGGHLRGEPGWGFAAPWGVVLVGVAWGLARRPRWIVARRRLVLAAGVACWSAAVFPWVARSPPDGRLAIYVLDVGQGDAIAVRTPRGRWLLIDAGPIGAGRRVVAPFLRRQGVERLGLMIVTHGDADHVGGAPVVIERFTPSLVAEPGQPLGSRRYLEFLGTVDGVGSRWIAARAGDSVVIDSVVVTVLHPSAAWLATQLEPNENSVVVRLSYGDFDAVLTGDIGVPAESALVPGLAGAEVLKVGHHGSAGSSSARWLDATRPSVAVISVGRRNTYGHPAAAVLRRLASRGIAVYRTDQGGTVTIRTDGRYFETVQGRPPRASEKLWCLIKRWSRSSASSWSASGCTPTRRVPSRIFSTTSP